ncbi:GAD-like domain-containing protein [Roseinatronobacter alkalisoli]|uniref:GAD-like domain-containing protein n=1 Tax=Roseinatronobacter alkalisoli TaxID=3028235 RepID=A0ABT5TFP0_9RHOB|nr:GAD-like domain-containing protein [Roseinatronobacter sp. HJB301]MDD7973950.1 GAD-like domain-containing protein [Roseinatronobacter sp. HJB301]
MNKEDFLEIFGTPETSQLVDRNLAERFRGLVPDDLVDFWIDHGIGAYAGSFYRLCTPDTFYPLLSRLLANIPTLRGKLHAVGYSAFGVVDLCHENGRIFSFDVQFGALTDQTSRRDNEPPPHDIADLYALAGIEMPASHEEAVSRIKLGPLSVWDELAIGASPETYRNYIGEDGRRLPSEVMKLLGPISANQIYILRSAELENIPASYVKTDIRDLLDNILSETVSVTEFITENGMQNTHAEIFPVQLR